MHTWIYQCQLLCACPHEYIRQLTRMPYNRPTYNTDSLYRHRFTYIGSWIQIGCCCMLTNGVMNMHGAVTCVGCRTNITFRTSWCASNYTDCHNLYTHRADQTDQLSRELVTIHSNNKQNSHIWQSDAAQLTAILWSFKNNVYTRHTKMTAQQSYKNHTCMMMAEWGQNVSPSSTRNITASQANMGERKHEIWHDRGST
jgi:hypothetical protein